jgi:light-regulated signal transduction histidine kinase (bacteriophytochrome)
VKPYNPSVLLSKTNVFLTLYRQNTALLGKVVELRQHRERLEELVMARTVNLKRQQAELKAANQELEAFAYSVSHDLRSPLRGVDGYSRLLLEGYADQLDDDGRFMLTQVRESAQEMGRLIDDLLTFSRLGRCGMKMQYCDMTTIVQDLFREMEQGHPARRLRLDLKALPSCSGDSGMIREVVRNLLDNAVKFTGTRDEAVIEVGMWNGEQKTGLIPDLPGGDQPLVVYYVKDNGVGFDTRYRDKLFQVFQRLHRSEDFEGTGIGLALVRRILQRHGGEICADSEPDNGATFYFSLPDIQMEGLGDG